MAPLVTPNDRGPTREPDFGTYHYSSTTASIRLRAVAKEMFADGFASLPFGGDDKLKILDVGCGLGFLSCASAEFYKNALIVGIDTYKHTSLKGSSLQRAKENVEILGFSDRIEFKNCDIFTFVPTQRFDIIVSNLVYHNLGKMRFNAYSRLSQWAQPGAFVVMGEFFFSPRADLALLSREFRILREARKRTGFRTYHLLVLSKA